MVFFFYVFTISLELSQNSMTSEGCLDSSRVDDEDNEHPAALDHTASDPVDSGISVLTPVASSSPAPSVPSEVGASDKENEPPNVQKVADW